MNETEEEKQLTKRIDGIEETTEQMSAKILIFFFFFKESKKILFPWFKYQDRPSISHSVMPHYSLSEMV